MVRLERAKEVGPAVAEGAEGTLDGIVPTSWSPAAQVLSFEAHFASIDGLTVDLLVMGSPG